MDDGRWDARHARAARVSDVLEEVVQELIVIMMMIIMIMMSTCSGRLQEGGTLTSHWV